MQFSSKFDLTEKVFYRDNDGSVKSGEITWLRILFEVSTETGGVPDVIHEAYLVEGAECLMYADELFKTEEQLLNSK